MMEYAYLVFFFEYTFALKWKSTQKFTDLLEGWREIFISFSKRNDSRRWKEHNLTPFFSIKFCWCAQQNLFAAWLIDKINYSFCMSILIFLVSLQAVMTNISFFLSKFVMFLKCTPFFRASYCIEFMLHWRVFVSDIF